MRRVGFEDYIVVNRVQELFLTQAEEYPMPIPEHFRAEKLTEYSPDSSFSSGRSVTYCFLHLIVSKATSLLQITRF